MGGSADRDRVLDAVKAAALLVVVLAHGLAWYGWDSAAGTGVSVLDVRPDMWWLTWLQVLPLFFAAGAVSNLASWQRRPGRGLFWQRRLLRLGTPALLYAVALTAVMLPVALVVPGAEAVGHLLPYHLWFLAFYGLVVLAVPWTSRWVQRPVVPLLVWLGLIAAVDGLRWFVLPVLGFLNLLLVWGWIHQLGYSLPRLRALPRARLVVGALLAFGAAAVLAGLLPYSRALVSSGADPELSNLSPPTLVLALFGLGQVLLLAAVWPWLERALRHENVWVVVRSVAARGIGLYLWHLPVMLVLAGLLLGLGQAGQPFGPVWWAQHLAVLVLAVAVAWVLAGVTGQAAARAQAWVLREPRRRMPVAAVAVLVPVATLLVALTGTGTWGGQAMGVPSSSLLALTLLAAGWWGLGVAGVGAGPPGSGVGADEAHPVPVLDAAEVPGGDTPALEQP